MKQSENENEHFKIGWIHTLYCLLLTHTHIQNGNLMLFVFVSYWWRWETNEWQHDWIISTWSNTFKWANKTAPCNLHTHTHTKTMNFTKCIEQKQNENKRSWMEIGTKRHNEWMATKGCWGVCWRDWRKISAHYSFAIWPLWKFTNAISSFSCSHQSQSSSLSSVSSVSSLFERTIRVLIKKLNEFHAFKSNFYWHYIFCHYLCSTLCNLPVPLVLLCWLLQTWQNSFRFGFLFLFSVDVDFPFWLNSSMLLLRWQNAKCIFIQNEITSSRQ